MLVFSRTGCIDQLFTTYINLIVNLLFIIGNTSSENVYILNMSEMNTHTNHEHYNILAHLE